MGQKDEEMRRFKEEPDAWRREVRSLVVDEGMQRTVRARAEARSSITEYDEQNDFKGKEKTQETILLSKHRYKRFKRLWDGMGASEASEEFDEKLEAAGTDNENSEGEAQVKTKQPVKFIEVTGSRTSTRTKTERPGRLPRAEGDGEGSRTRRMANKKEGRRDSSSSGEPRGRRRKDAIRAPAASESPSPVRRGRSTPKTSPAGSPPPPQERPPTDNKAITKLTRTALLRHNKKKAPEDDTSSAFSAGSARRTTVQILKIKSDLKKALMEILRTMHAKNSIMKQVLALKDKLNPDQLNEAGYTEESLKDCAAGISKAHKLIDAMDSKRPAELDGVSTEVATIEADLIAASTKAEELMEAMEYLLSKNSAARHKDKQHHRYVKNRVAKNMTMGGYGGNFAKTLAAAILKTGEKVTDDTENMLSNPKEVDVKKVCVWTSEPDAGETVRTTMQNILEACTAKIAEKVTNLSNTIASKKDWTGAMAKLEFLNTDFDFSGFTLPAEICRAGTAGADPWVVAQKAWAFRFWPEQLAAPWGGGLRGAPYCWDDGSLRALGAIREGGPRGLE